MKCVEDGAIVVAWTGESNRMMLWQVSECGRGSIALDDETREIEG